MDFISIIIPAYNSERWLARCLDSIIAAYDPDCEVIIVDDGSSDSTPQIARRYADMDPRISTITVSHRGPYAARKAGLLESHGDYVIFVDSDDVMKPNSIRDHRRLSLAPNKRDLEDDVVLNTLTCRRQADGRPMMIIANTTERLGGDKAPLLITGHRRALTGNEYVLEVLRNDIPGYFPGHMYSRQLLEATNWDDDPSITHHGDQYLVLSMAMKLQEMANAGHLPQRLILVDPSIVCYEYIRRPGSQAAMMSLTHEGLNRIWRNLCALNLPEPEFTYWGIDLLRTSFVERGIPFENNFEMALDISARARQLGSNLPERFRETIDSLLSVAKRRKIARRLARTGGLTAVAPHISYIIVCHENYRKVSRTVRSIYNTGLRNLEVILVDYDNKHSTSVKLNELTVLFPRMRIIKSDARNNFYNAMRTGVSASKGLALSFLRPGDIIGAEGYYDAVRSVDYGADMVLINSRRRSRILKICDSPTSFDYLNQLSVSPYNIYDTLMKHLCEDRMGREFLGYGLVWRREKLVDTGIDVHDFDGFESAKLTRSILMKLLASPCRVVAQGAHVPAAYTYSVRSIIMHAITGRVAAMSL